MNNKFSLRERIRNGDVLIGMFAKFNNCSAVEMVGIAGFDFVIFDTEHANFSRTEIENLVRTADSVGMSSVVRVQEAIPEEVLHALDSGADGVQVATPFVTTEECDAADAFKQAYVDARAENVEIIKSPVGMPARAIRNAFLEKMKQGRETITKCYRCLEKCNPREAPYCITQALIRSVQGDVENGLIFCGDNVQYLTRISTVSEVIRTLFA